MAVRKGTFVASARSLHQVPWLLFGLAWLLISSHMPGRTRPGTGLATATFSACMTYGALFASLLAIGGHAARVAFEGSSLKIKLNGYGSAIHQLRTPVWRMVFSLLLAELVQATWCLAVLEKGQHDESRHTLVLVMAALAGILTGGHSEPMPLQGGPGRAEAAQSGHSVLTSRFDEGQEPESILDSRSVASEKQNSRAPWDIHRNPLHDSHGLNDDSRFSDEEPGQPSMDSPADFILDMLGQLLDGQMPDAQDLHTLRHCLDAGPNRYTPLSVQEQVAATPMDADVEEALMQRLLGVAPVRQSKAASSIASPLLTTASHTSPNLPGILEGSEVLDLNEPARPTNPNGTTVRMVLSKLMCDVSPLDEPDGQRTRRGSALRDSNSSGADSPGALLIQAVLSRRNSAAMEYGQDSAGVALAPTPFTGRARAGPGKCASMGIILGRQMTGNPKSGLAERSARDDRSSPEPEETTSVPPRSPPPFPLQPLAVQQQPAAFGSNFSIYSRDSYAHRAGQSMIASSTGGLSHSAEQLVEELCAGSSQSAVHKVRRRASFARGYTAFERQSGLVQRQSSSAISSENLLNSYAEGLIGVSNAASPLLSVLPEDGSSPSHYALEWPQDATTGAASVEEFNRDISSSTGDRKMGRPAVLKLSKSLIKRGGRMLDGLFSSGNKFVSGESDAASHHDAIMTASSAAFMGTTSLLSEVHTDPGIVTQSGTSAYVLPSYKSKRTSPTLVPYLACPASCPQCGYAWRLDAGSLATLPCRSSTDSRASRASATPSVKQGSSSKLFAITDALSGGLRKLVRGSSKAAGQSREHERIVACEPSVAQRQTAGTVGQHHMLNRHAASSSGAVSSVRASTALHHARTSQSLSQVPVSYAHLDTEELHVTQGSHGPVDASSGVACTSMPWASQHSVNLRNSTTSTFNSYHNSKTGKHAGCAVVAAGIAQIAGSASDQSQHEQPFLPGSKRATLSQLDIDTPEGQIDGEGCDGSFAMVVTPNSFSGPKQQAAASSRLRRSSAVEEEEKPAANLLHLASQADSSAVVPSSVLVVRDGILVASHVRATAPATPKPHRGAEVDNAEDKGLSVNSTASVLSHGAMPEFQFKEDFAGREQLSVSGSTATVNNLLLYAVQATGAGSAASANGAALFGSDSSANISLADMLQKEFARRNSSSLTTIGGPASDGVVALAQQAWASNRPASSTSVSRSGSMTGVGANGSLAPHSRPRPLRSKTANVLCTTVPQAQTIKASAEEKTEAQPAQAAKPISQGRVRRKSVRDLLESNAQPSAAMLDEVELLLAKADTQVSFDAFRLADATRGHALSALGFYLLTRTHLVSTFSLHPIKLARWLRTIELGYKSNPYHNATHAADVLQTLHVTLHMSSMVNTYVDPLMLLSCYLAAVVHDYEHKGVTNDYLVNTADPLAIRYNDKAPMENHHLAAAFTTLRTPSLNFTSGMGKQDYDCLRKNVIELVLATDMKSHFALVGQFNSNRRQVTLARSLSGLVASSNDVSCGAHNTGVPLSAHTSTSAPALAALSGSPSSRTSHSRSLVRTSARSSVNASGSLRSLMHTTSGNSMPLGSLTTTRLGPGGGSRQSPLIMVSTGATATSDWSLNTGQQAETPSRATMGPFSAEDFSSTRWSDAGNKPAPNMGTAGAQEGPAGTDVGGSSTGGVGGLRTFLQSPSMKQGHPGLLQSHHTYSGSSFHAHRHSGRMSALNAPDSHRLSTNGGLLSGLLGTRNIEEMSQCGHVIAPLDDAERMLSIQMAFKLSDLGHIAEGLDVHLRWVAALEEEFFLQGDKEREQGLPISPLFDRNKPGVTKSQVGFFEFVVLPLFKAFANSFPGAKPLLAGVHDNYKYWKARQPPAAASEGQ